MIIQRKAKKIKQIKRPLFVLLLLFNDKCPEKHFYVVFPIGD
jgi:hypothetical protein